MLNGEGSEEGKKATISLISSVDIKVKSKKKDSALLLFFLPEISGNHTIYRQNARVLETRNLTSAYMKGVGVGVGGPMDDFVRTKISWMNSTGVLVLERPYLGRVAGHL